MVVVDDKVGQGWIVNMDTEKLEIRRVQPGMYLGQSVQIVDGKAIADDEESFDDMISTMISRQILRRGAIPVPMIQGKRVITDELNTEIGSTDRSYELRDYGKPTTRFESHTPATLVKLAQLDIPCSRITRLETLDDNYDSMYLLDSFSCNLIKMEILKSVYTTVKVDIGLAGKRVIHVYNPFELVGIWFAGFGGKILLRKVTYKPLLRDRIFMRGRC